MRRLIAVVLVQALAVSAATALSLHVHAYAGHDHPEHHHGPASHEHGTRHAHAAGPEPDGGIDHHHDQDGAALGAESCDPGHHAIAVGIGGTSVPQGTVDVAEMPGPTSVLVAAAVFHPGAASDIRLHGPPSHVRLPSRAPPFLPHA